MKDLLCPARNRNKMFQFVITKKKKKAHQIDRLQLQQMEIILKGRRIYLHLYSFNYERYSRSPMDRYGIHNP